ncbi:MAG: protease [Chloroflexota bacterium]|jgi:protease I|nr:protease [Chloroflexota bacterium]
MRIACLLDRDFEDSEFQQPYDAFRDAGHLVTIVGLKAGAELAGKKGHVKATTDAAVADVSAADFDALLIPGGFSPDHLRAHDEVVAFTKAFFTDERPVMTICHGPQLLITAGVVKGRRMTAWKTVADDLRQVGADVSDEEVVVDGSLVTSRKPDDIPAFVRESLRVMERVGATA